MTKNSKCSEKGCKSPSSIVLLGKPLCPNCWEKHCSKPANSLKTSERRMEEEKPMAKTKDEKISMWEKQIEDEKQKLGQAIASAKKSRAIIRNCWSSISEHRKQQRDSKKGERKKAIEEKIQALKTKIEEL